VEHLTGDGEVGQRVAGRPGTFPGGFGVVRAPAPANGVNSSLCQAGPPAIYYARGPRLGMVQFL
jgi:hypothetical protein